MEDDSKRRDTSQCTLTALQTYRYDFPWEQVVAANLLRFPTHPRIPVLLATEVVSDRLDEVNRRRYVVRRVVLDIEAPAWVKKTVGLHQFVAFQHTTFDFAKRSMRIHNINDTWIERALLGDDCEYRADPEDAGRTYFEQRAFFSLPRSIPMIKFVEKLMAKNYDKHTGEGRLLDEEFCRIAIQTGYWKRLSEGGPDAIMRMPVEQVPEKRATRKTKAFEREQQELIPSTSGAPKKGSFAISEFSAEESSAKASEDPPTRLSVASRLAGAVRNASLPLITDQDARNEAIAENHDAYVMLVVGLTVLVGWPLWISVSSPAMVSMVTVLLYSALLRWHFRRFPLFWNALLVRSVVAASTMTSPPQSAAVPRVTMMREQLHSLASNLQQTAVQEPDFDAPMTSMEHSTPIITQTSASPSLPSKAPHVQNTTLRRRPQTSNGATKPSPRISPERATTLTDDNNVVGDARRNSSASDVEFDRDDDLDSSDGEHDDSLPMQQQLQDEDDDDDDVELDEEEMRVFNDPEDDDAVSRFFANVSNEVDTELGDISTISLRDIRVKAPVFVDRSIFGSDQQIVYILQITFPNRVKRTVERLYTDFVRLQKHLALTVPQCKVRMKTTYLPKKRLSNQTSIGIVLDQRRSVVETYMRELLADEVIAKLGHRVLMEFLRQRGVLFAPPSAGLVANARKRLFLSSPSAASTVSDTANNNANVKNVIMMKFRWRTCLRETRIALDRVGGTLQLYCQFPPLKEVHCSIPVDEIEDVLHLNDLPDAAQRLPFIGDKYHFMEVRTSHKESFYFCAAREVVVEWMQDILSLRQQFRTEPPRSPYKNSASMSASARSFSNPYRCKRPTLESSNSDNRIILNRRRLMLGKAAISKRHPCVVISELLELILGIFQEYTDSKCVFLPKIAQRLLTFAEQSTELQVVDLAKLETHAERLAFHLNLYHTMIIHSHLELGFGPSPSSSKRLKMIFRTICYDVHNQIFSIQDIEHSMLRAKMSRPATMTNTIFAQLLSPRLNRRDPRNEWALTQPDLRINFVLNSGTKSSIYNVWSFSSDKATLSHQLDHASTHFLNEQVVINADRFIIYFPRICQYYYYDLGGSKQRILKTLMRYMSPSMESDVKQLMKQAKARGYKVKLRYADYDWSVRGVFFRGHELGNSSSSEQQQQCTLLQPAGIGELFLPSSALPSAVSAKQQQRQHEPESAQLTRDRAQSDSVD